MGRALSSAALNLPFEDVAEAVTVGRLVPAPPTGFLPWVATRLLLNAARECDKIGHGRALNRADCRSRFGAERALRQWVQGAPAPMSLWLACHLAGCDFRRMQRVLMRRMRGEVAPIPQVVAGSFG